MIRAAAELVRAGSGVDVDVIVVDNASVDGTPAVARSLGATVVHEPVQGIARARSRVSGPAGRRPQGRAARRSALPTGGGRWHQLEEPLASFRQGGDPAEELLGTAARTAHPDRADHHTGSLQ